MPIKKNNKATNAAVQQGLNVRGAAVVTAKKATKATAAAIKKNAVAKPVAAPAKPRKVAAAPVKATVSQRTWMPRLSAEPLWADDATLSKASIAVKKFTADSNPGTFGQDNQAKRIAAFRKSEAYWAQANRNIIRGGEKIVAKGEWLIAFDSPADSILEGKTFVMTNTGRLIYSVAPEDTKLDVFTFLTA